VQLTQGLEYALPGSMLGRTTFFFQPSTTDTPGVSGRSFGAEQFVRRDFTRRLAGFFSYTLSRTEEKYGALTLRSPYDRTHVVSAVVGYDLGGGYRIGARGYLASGRSVRVWCPTPDCGPGDPMAPRRFTRDVDVPAFFRLDVRFEKRWKLGERAWITGTFEWFNALLASEVQGVDYTRLGISLDRQSPLTLPSIGVEAGW
jgi:hypothetical protein